MTGKGANASADTDVAQAQSGGGAHGATGQDAHSVHAADMDATGSRVNRIDQDTGTDERYNVESADRSSMAWLNVKRTYDLHQTMDMQALTDKSKHQAKLDSMEIQAAEQRLLHQAKINSQEMAERSQDHAQRVRFADANMSVQVALLGDMAEKLGAVHAAVCGPKS